MPADSTVPDETKRSGDDPDWIRRQARTVRALAAEQRRWVKGLDPEALRRFARSPRARAAKPAEERG